MDDREPLSRLSEREKVCLRQWLQHKSAKEIAADIGISHHAVEKRLKMARTKLGATSSLEAARMLVEAEGYGQAVAQPPDLVSDPRALHSSVTRLSVIGVAIMILVGALLFGLLSYPATFTQAPPDQSGGRGEQVSTTGAVPNAGTEAALRKFVAGVASGSPEYDKLSPQFAEIVREGLPRTHSLFASLGELKSMSFRGRGARGDDIYRLVFNNGELIMSAALDAEGRITGGILQPVGEPVLGADVGASPGTEAALRSLVAGLANGSPDYTQLAPQFADLVRRDLPMTHAMFSGMGDLKSMAFRGRDAMGNDIYQLVFANGELVMSAGLDANGKMAGGILKPGVAPTR